MARIRLESSVLGEWLDTIGDDLSPACDDTTDPMLERHVHARSRFRSVTHPDRFALYSVHERGEMFGGPATPGGPS